MQPDDLLTESKEVLVKMLEKFNLVYEEMMQNMVMIREELLHRLEEEKKDGELILEYAIRKNKRVTFKTTLEEAEVLGAIKKAVDSDVLKKLYNKGIKVPGVNETIYLSVRRLDQNEQEEQAK